MLCRQRYYYKILAGRFIVFTIFTWIFYIVVDAAKEVTVTEKGQEIIFVGAGLCGVCLYYLFENIALTYTQASNVSVIVSTAPLFVTIMAHFFLNRRNNYKNISFSDVVCADCRNHFT